MKVNPDFLIHSCVNFRLQKKVVNSLPSLKDKPVVKVESGSTKWKRPIERKKNMFPELLRRILITKCPLGVPGP